MSSDESYQPESVDEEIIIVGPRAKPKAKAKNKVQQPQVAKSLIAHQQEMETNNELSGSTGSKEQSRSSFGELSAVLCLSLFLSE
jgi:hypothetical protein